MSFARKSFTRKLLAWYDNNRRPLPWRSSANSSAHPYHTLLSEFMLQQTQVSTVIPYFDAFLRRFATLPELAAADEQEILRLWQGLGYYSRARNLLRAARQIVAEHNGIVPKDVDTLLTLPGIGRYTAGAIASIAYDRRAPIVDGNVARVLCRVFTITQSLQDRSTQQRLWAHAEEVVPATRCGDFNSGLMELGAIVCTPRNPKCLTCPVQKLCGAFEQGLVDQIPPPKAAKPSPRVHRWTFCLGRGKGHSRKWLIEQRPEKGRWAGMWQFVTAEAGKSPATAADVHAVAGVKSSPPTILAQIKHTLSHRQYRFDVYLCDLCRPARGSHGKNQPRRWVGLEELHRYPLPRPHLRIAAMLRGQA